MWTPISASELEELVAKALQQCTPGQAQAFARYRVPPYQVPIHRIDQLEPVFVVAELPAGLLYYEDVEEGFEISHLAKDGSIAELGCNQFELKHVLAQCGF